MATTADIIRVVEILGPLLLSGLLVALYYQQYRLQKVQFRPSIEVSDTEGEGDIAKIWLSNYGGGIARDLRVETVCFHEEGDEPYRVQTLLHRADEDSERTRERSIGANERSVLFVGEPRYIVPAGEAMPAGWPHADFSTAFRQLAIDGVTETGFLLFVIYQTQLGETRRERVSPYAYSIKFDEDDLEKIAQGRLTIDYEMAVSLGSIGTRSVDEAVNDFLEVD